MNSLKEKVKNGEIVIRQTHKSERNIIDSPANCKISVQTYISNNEPITKEEYDELKKEITTNDYKWGKILMIGKDTNAQYRTQNSLKIKKQRVNSTIKLTKRPQTGICHG